MSVETIRVARFSEHDYEVTNRFLSLMENLFDSRRGIFRQSWEEWPEDNEDGQLLRECRSDLAAEMRVEENEVDEDLISFRAIRRRYLECDLSWHRVLMAALILEASVCDPARNTLEYHPFIERALDNSMLGE